MFGHFKVKVARFKVKVRCFKVKVGHFKVKVSRSVTKVLGTLTLKMVTLTLNLETLTLKGATLTFGGCPARCDVRAASSLRFTKHCSHGGVLTCVDTYSILGARFFLLPALAPTGPD